MVRLPETSQHVAGLQDLLGWASCSSPLFSTGHPVSSSHQILSLCRLFTAVVQDAVVKGWFRTSRDPTKGGPDYRAIAMTALEVASAMAFLHSHDIIHGVSALWQAHTQAACSSVLGK